MEPNEDEKKIFMYRRHLAIVIGIVDKIVRIALGRGEGAEKFVWSYECKTCFLITHRMCVY